MVRAATKDRVALLATFRVGSSLLAVDAARVQEILKDLPMVRVPGTDSSIRGLVNLRGQVIIAIGLAERLAIEPTTDDAPFSVVIRTSEGPVIILVDSVGEVLDASRLDPDPPPDTLAPGLARLVEGVHQRDGELLLVVDVDGATAVRSGTDDDTNAGDGETVMTRIEEN